MNPFKKNCLTAVIFALTVVGILSFVTAGIAEVKVFTHIEASGTSFNPGDSFSIYVVPVNQSGKYLNNLQVNLALPKNIVLTNTILPDKPDKLDPYEAKVFEYIVKNGNPLKVALPVTGDKGFPVAVWILVLAAAGLLFWKTGMKRGTSLFLVICFCIQFIPAKTIAEEKLIIGEDGVLWVNLDGKKETVTSSATATEGQNMTEVDADGDGLFAENEKIYGTDDNKTDTDGDGLPDGYEVYFLGTNPAKIDTDENGIPDGSEDADNDGLTNLDEMGRKTNPGNHDTDGDGLDDGNEVTRGTNPLKADTDGDGMLDGFEDRNNFNPLVYDETVTTISDHYGAEDASSSVTANVTVTNATGVQAQSLCIREIPDFDAFMNKDLKGWIGNACEITMENSSNVTATLTMTYDRNLIGDDFDPAIFFYDEENQRLTEIPNQSNNTENGSVSAPLTHFSTYILLNKKKRITKQSVNSIPLSTFDDGVAILLDSEPNASSDAATNLWNDVQDRFTKVIQEILGERKITALHVVDNTVYGVETYYQSINQLLTWSVSNINDKKDFFLISCNPKKQVTESEAQTIANTAKDKGIRINIILIVKGLNYTDNDVKGAVKLANLTGGKCYSLTDAESFFSSLRYAPFDYNKDSNNDGISDGRTWDIINGNIFCDVENVFGKYTYAQVQAAGADLDDDRLDNGEEISFENINGVEYVHIKTLPAVADSDYDGIKDGEDLSPMRSWQWLRWREGNLDGGLDVKFYMNYRWFSSAPTKYNPFLAVTSSLISSLAYNNEDSTLENRNSGALTREKAFKKFLGMKDSAYEEQNNLKNVVTKKLFSPNKDLTAHNAMVTLGHHEYEYDNRKHMVVLAAITGYHHLGREWYSNFTVGDPNEQKYWEASGWRDSNNHLGFDIGASIVKDEIYKYLKERKKIVDSVDEVDIWITGHSRGGAVSNLTAAKIIDDKYGKDNKYKVFAYTFATPMGVKKSENERHAKKYASIFNIINEVDAVPRLPLSNWGFGRYGEDKFFNIHESKIDAKSIQDLNDVIKIKYNNEVDVETAFLGMMSNDLLKFRSGLMEKSNTLEDGVNIIDKAFLDRAFNVNFVKIAKNRADLYKLYEVYNYTETPAPKSTPKKTTLDSRIEDYKTSEEIIKEASKSKNEKTRLRIFRALEDAREYKFTVPEERPNKDNTKSYYILTDDTLEIRPQLTMVMLGYVASELLNENFDAYFEFSNYRDLYALPGSLKGFLDMVLGSGFFSAHTGAAYYLGSYLCK